MLLQVINQINLKIMKNSILIIFVILFYSLFCSSCKKESASESSPDANTITTPRISRMFNSWTGTMSYYSYDSKGRLIKELDSIHYSYGIARGMSTSYYYADSIITELVTDYNQESSLQVLYLNSKGLLVTRNFCSAVPNTGYSMKFTYEYDNNNYLIKQNNNGSIITYTILNGNVDNINLGHGIVYNYNYSNYLNTIGNENFGQSFLGKQSINLNSGYTYQFDSKNRVSSMTYYIGTREIKNEYYYTN